MPYDKYNYEQVYTEDLTEDLPECTEIIGCDLNCIQKTVSTKAGEMVEIQSFPSFLHRKDYSRVKRLEKSLKKQQALNEKNSRKKIVRIVNANFTIKDIWGTFGWDNERMPPMLNDARREFTNFISRINYRRKKRGKAKLKYVYVIEITAGNPQKGESAVKYHVHIIMSGDVDRDEIESLWYGGEYPQTRRLKIKDFGGLTGLATYISKGPAGKRRWGQSLGLKQWTHKPTSSYSRFRRSDVRKLIKDRNALKEVLEKKYPGYAYSEDYPAEIKYNDLIGGYYLYCRMYKKHFAERMQGKRRC